MSAPIASPTFAQHRIGLVPAPGTATGALLTDSGFSSALVINPTTGAVVLAAPTTTTPTLTVNQYQGSGSNAGLFVQAGATYQGTISVAGGGLGQGAALALRQGSAGDSYLWNYSNNSLTFGTNNATCITIASTGGVTVAAPTSSYAFIANGLAGIEAARFNGSSTSGQSFGLVIFAGTTAADAAFSVINQAGTTNLFKVGGTGALTFGGVATTTAAPGAGGAGALPATPKGYFSVTISGYAGKVPYY